MIEEASKSSKTTVEKRQLFMEMRAQNFDVIRLSTYRTACKLRFVQKRCNLHLVDVWNMIEAFRDNGLSTLDHNAEINVSRLETILSSIFYQLNKRLPTTHQINVEQSIGLLLNFMVATYDSEGHGKLTVFAMKSMLATMCGGKIVDKLRYIFSQISDSSGTMVFAKFDQFLREVLKLPTAVFEGPSFGYTDHSVRTCFPQQGPTRGFERDVGYKTTHHVLYPESAIDLPNPSVSLLLAPFKTLDLEWLISAFTTAHINYTYMPVPTRIKANRNKVLVYNPAFLKYVQESWNENHGRYPSTGFLTIIFALHICDQVNVFGFGANQNGDWHHYWEDEEPDSAFKETLVHHANNEQNITQKLSQHGKVTFYKGVQTSSARRLLETQTFRKF